MNIKYLSTLLLLSMTLLLTACIGEVSNENEAGFGTFAPSLEGEIADNFIRDVVDLKETFSGEVQFQHGYTVLGSNSSLYVGVYEYPGKVEVTESWAKILQTKLLEKRGWIEIVDNSENDGGGVTIYDTADDFSDASNGGSTAAVRVKPNNFDNTYWIHVAVPDRAITDIDHPNVKKQFKKHRETK